MKVEIKKGSEEDRRGCVDTRGYLYSQQLMALIRDRTVVGG